MSTATPQPQTTVKPVGGKPGYGKRGTQAALAAHAAWEKQIKGVKPADVIEVAVTFERLRRRTPIGWLQSAAVGIGGGGFGALLTGGRGFGVYAALFLGFGIAFGLQFAIHERADNLANVCAEFMRFINRWPPMGEHDHANNSAYVRAIVAEENQSLLTRWQEWRAHRGKDEAKASA